jgi:hypothetical protein
MSDIQQSKSILAKLLATENLIVEHRSVQTASFDTHNRILTLPVWEGTSGDVYDLLVGHEVGHAIYTPDLYGSDLNLPQGYLNVIEDARIEKLMKRKYPGLARAFYRGYSELNDRDFFEIEFIDVNKLKFIDKINLYFKLGNVNGGVFINFTPDENVIVGKVADAETFDDVINIVKELVEYAEHEVELQVDMSSLSGAGTDESGDGADGEVQNSDSGETQSLDSTVSNNQAQNFTPSDSDKNKTTSNKSDPSSSSNSEKEGDLTSDTDNAWTKNQQQLASITGKTYIYTIPPTIRIDNHILSWKNCVTDIPNIFSTLINDAGTSGYRNKIYYETMFTKAENTYKTYKDNCKKSVSYLIKEFEMKKRATEYNRSATATTGVLDTNKMYSYKWNDDIFKKVTVVPTGKSHGLIMYFDWSGSMQGNLVETIKQLFNLIQFCKKVQIPFEVYSFNDRNLAKNYAHISRNNVTKISNNQIYITQDFVLINLLSSKMNIAQLETQMKNVWKLAYALDYSTYLPYEYSHYDLGSTPLNECIFAAIEVFKKFKKTYKVDKVNTVFLTDGESNSVSFNRSTIGSNKNIVHAGWLQNDEILCFQDKINKITMMNIGKNGSIGITGAFVDYYRQVTGSNAVGFRLIDFYAARSFVSKYLKTEFSSWNDVSAEWGKCKSFTATSLGYNELYFIEIGNKSSQTIAANSSNVVSTFKTEMSKKAFNKIILSKFIEQIA